MIVWVGEKAHFVELSVSVYSPTLVVAQVKMSMTEVRKYSLENMWRRERRSSSDRADTNSMWSCT